MEENDVQLQFKKRARRRLVGAVFFASIVAVVLPMVMDNEPRQAVPEVEVRIPGQDERTFAPKFAVAPVESPAPAESHAVAESKAQPDETVKQPTARVLDPIKEARVEKTPEKPVSKAEKPAEKPAAKPVDKAPEKARPDDAKRAASILAGKAGEDKPAAKGGEFLVLIGAFANDDNVRHLKSKLGELGIRTFSEPLDTPQGRKTRVRAGPFPSREAAEKALEKMKKIGVTGVVAPRS